MGKKKVGRFVYNKDDILGTGQYGKVYLAEDTANTEKVAVKIIDKQKSIFINYSWVPLNCQAAYSFDAVTESLCLWTTLKRAWTLYYF